MLVSEEKSGGNALSAPFVSQSEMESMLNLQTFMIRMIAKGHSLSVILRALTIKLEEHFNRRTYCSILLAGEGGKLLLEHAPTLPYEYQQALRRIEAGPNAGSCGTAVYRKKMVISADIGNDPLWENCRHAALRHGLLACWSMPILIGERVVGTFAIYHSEISAPTVSDVAILETCASLAGLAIERDQRMKLEQQLQESEQRFKSLFEYYPHAIYSFSLDGKFLGFNPVTESVSGYSHEELLGKSYLPLIALEDRERVLQHFNEAKKGIVQHYECKFVHKSGKILVLSLTNTPIVVNGEVVGVYGVGRDITYEKMLEQELHSAHKEMKHLFKNHQGMIFKYKKENGRFIHTFGDGQLIQRIGLKIEECAGKSLFELMPAEYASQKEAYYEQAWNGNKTSYEGELNGIHYIATMSPVFQRGQVIEVIVSCIDITDLKKAHEELRETKELLESIVSNTADAIMTADIDGQFTYVNKAFADLFGWQEKELLTKELSMVLHNHKKNLPHFSKIDFSDKKASRFEANEKRKDGSPISVSVTLSPLKGKNGALNGAAAIIRDITEQKRIEEELEESQQRYKSLFSSHPDLVYSVDVNGTVINANFSIQKTLGYTPEQVMKKHYGVLIDKLSFNKTDGCFQKALQGTPQTFETAGVHKNGQRVLLQMTYVPIFVNNRIVGVHGIAKDITEHKQSQQEMVSLKQKMELVLDSVGDGIFALDKNQKIKLINPAGAALLGYEVEKLVGTRPTDTFRHGRKADQCMMYQTLLDGKVRDITDEFFFRKNGTDFPVEYVSSPIWENGEISGVVVAFRDISEKKMAEEYFLKSAKLEMAGQLAAGVAHEIRNPLTSIQGFVQLLEGETDKEEYFSIMRSEFERIEDIISEFLALAKPQAVNFQENDVGLLLQQTIYLMSAQASMQGVEVKAEIESELPFIQCDKHQLKQVFINVIKNAIEATESQGELTITCEKELSSLHIVFQDQGTGIPPERIKHLFEPFYSTKEKGTGLGLMISYKIIEEHKGMIWAESGEGEGTAIHILLPI